MQPLHEQGKIPDIGPPSYPAPPPPVEKQAGENADAALNRAPRSLDASRALSMPSPRQTLTRSLSATDVLNAPGQIVGQPPGTKVRSPTLVRQTEDRRSREHTTHAEAVRAATSSRVQPTVTPSDAAKADAVSNRSAAPQATGAATHSAAPQAAEHRDDTVALPDIEPSRSEIAKSGFLGLAKALGKCALMAGGTLLLPIVLIALPNATAIGKAANKRAGEQIFGENIEKREGETRFESMKRNFMSNTFTGDMKAIGHAYAGVAGGIAKGFKEFGSMVGSATSGAIRGGAQGWNELSKLCGALRNSALSVEDSDLEYNVAIETDSSPVAVAQRSPPADPKLASTDSSPVAVAQRSPPADPTLASIAPTVTREESVVAVKMRPGPTERRLETQSNIDEGFEIARDTFSSAMQEALPDISLSVRITGQEPTSQAMIDPEKGYMFDPKTHASTGVDTIQSYNGQGIAMNVASGYPQSVNARLGDPIADQMAFRAFQGEGESKVLLYSGADGSNWGTKPRNTALAVNSGFMDYCEEKLRTGGVTTPGELCSLAIQGVQAGQKEIAKLNQLGRTTHLGIIAKQETVQKEGKPVKVTRGVVTSVGDMKLFILKKDGSSVEVTRGNRGNVADPSNPGGQLGGQGGVNAEGVDEREQDPNLNNLSVFYFEAEEGDILLPMSDGIHDNLDPHYLGMESPQQAKQDLVRQYETDLQDANVSEARKSVIRADLALVQKLDLPEVFEVTKEERNTAEGPAKLKKFQAKEDQLEILKQKYLEMMVREKSKKAIQENSEAIKAGRMTEAQAVSQALVQHSYDNAKNTRENMEKNPGKKQQPTSKDYPGKMDHLSCAAIAV